MTSTALQILPAWEYLDRPIGSKHYTTWTIAILPYMEEQATYDLFMKNRNASVPQSFLYDDPIHATFQQTFLKTMLCPSDINIDQLAQPEWGRAPTFCGRPDRTVRCQAVRRARPATTIGTTHKSPMSAKTTCPILRAGAARNSGNGWETEIRR